MSGMENNAEVRKYGERYEVWVNGTLLHVGRVKGEVYKWASERAMTEMHWRYFLAMPTHRKSDGVMLIKESY